MEQDQHRIGIFPALFALVLFIALPLAGVWQSLPTIMANAPAATGSASIDHPPSPPPPVEPLIVKQVDPETARQQNAAVPFSTLPNPAAKAFSFAGADDARGRAIDCLAAAEWYEAGDDATGEQAVAQVVLNRVRHPAFPNTVCAVVFQGSERVTGCQFTFTCDGALARTPSDAAWDRARAIARQALTGTVFKPVGYSTHYHTDWVLPYWSSSLDKVTSVGTHLFFRWAGWWGTPPAFRRLVSNAEPVIPQLARISEAHRINGIIPDAPVNAPLGGAAAMASAPKQAFGTDAFGKKFGAARLVAIDAQYDAYILTLDRGSDPAGWPAVARTFCGGRASCRILAWIDQDVTPRSFPIPQSSLPAMAFSYIHDSGNGLQRALWNCKLYPEMPQGNCMRRRDPTLAPSGQPVDAPMMPRRRFETFTVDKAGTVNKSNVGSAGNSTDAAAE